MYIIYIIKSNSLPNIKSHIHRSNWRYHKYILIFEALWNDIDLMRLRSWQVTPHWSVKACLLGTDDLVAIRGSFVHSFLRHLGRRMMTNVYICHNHYICWYNDHSITTKQIQHVMELTLIIWQCIQWRLAFSTHTPKPRWLQLTKETLTPIYIYIYIHIYIYCKNSYIERFKMIQHAMICIILSN